MLATSPVAASGSPAWNQGEEGSMGTKKEIRHEAAGPTR